MAQLAIVGNPMRSQPEAPTEVVGGISDGSGSPACATATASLGMNVYVHRCEIFIYLYICMYICMYVCMYVCVCKYVCVLCVYARTYICT